MQTSDGAHARVWSFARSTKNRKLILAAPTRKRGREARDGERRVEEWGMGSGERGAGGLTCGAERVLARKLPHAGDELCEAPNEEGHADDDVGDEDAAGLNIVQRKDEGRRREAEQAAECDRERRKNQELPSSVSQHSKTYRGPGLPSLR